MSGYPKSWRIHPGSPLSGLVKLPRPTGRKPYTIRNAADGTTEIYLYGEIWEFGVTAEEFAAELAAITARKITVRVNSPGGDVFDGLAIHSAIKRHPAEITMHVDGVAASMASVVIMAGDLIVMSRSAKLMIHDAQGLTIGNAADHKRTMDLLDRYSNTLADLYAARAGGTRKQWRDRMIEETWYDADEAVAAGLADEVADDTADREREESRVAAGLSPQHRQLAAAFRAQVAGGRRPALATGDFEQMAAAFRAVFPDPERVARMRDELRTARETGR